MFDWFCLLIYMTLASLSHSPPFHIGSVVSLQQLVGFGLRAEKEQSLWLFAKCVRLYVNKIFLGINCCCCLNKATIRGLVRVAGAGG